jgi:hypothetical protein
MAPHRGPYSGLKLGGPRAGASPSDDPDSSYKMQFSCTGRNPL